ncbi:hypothetical protein HK097_010462, partial [Rhizophlyctis rosea]
MLPIVDTFPTPIRLLLHTLSFLIGLYLLERGADKFIDSTAILAKRLHIPQIAIALLTAGAEWEELFVVLLAVLQGHPNLGLGNILGSCVANILGSFS